MGVEDLLDDGSKVLLFVHQQLQESEKAGQVILTGQQGAEIFALCHDLICL